MAKKKRPSFFDDDEEEEEQESNLPPSSSDNLPPVSNQSQIPQSQTPQNDQMVLMQQMMSTMQSMMAAGGMPGSGWASASPFQQQGTEPKETEAVPHDIILPKTLERGKVIQKPLAVHPLFGKLFMIDDDTFLDGIPKGCTMTLTGPAYTGKTRAALEMVIRAIMQGVKTAYVVAEEGFYDENESGRNDLFSRFLELAEEISGLSAEEFRKKYDDDYVIIPNQYHLGKSWADFIKDYRYVAEELGVTFFLVDSINMLDPSKRNTVDNLNALKTYNHDQGITCLVIGQVKDSGQPQGGEELFHTSEVSLHIYEMTMTSKALAETWDSNYRDSIQLLSARSKVCGTIGYPIKIRFNNMGLLRADPSQPSEHEIPMEFWKGMDI